MADTANTIVEETKTETTNKSVFTNTDTSLGSNNVYLVDFRVYIAGILIPVNDITMLSGISEPPRASFSVPPYPEFFPIGEHDKVPVHIFARESVIGSDKLLLIFEGYITSRIYINTATQRSIHFEAVSIFNLVNDVKFQYMSSYDELIKDHAGANSERALHGFNSLIQSELFFILKGIPQRSDSDAPPIEFPSQFLQNIFDLVCNSTKKDLKQFNQSTYAGFYSKYGLMLKLLDRFTPLPYFDFSHPATEKGKDELYARDIDQTNIPWKADADHSNGCLFPTLEGIQRGAQVTFIHDVGSRNLAKESSLASLLSLISDYMDYEYLVIPNPAYHKKRVYGKFPLLSENKSELVCTVLKPLLHDSTYVPKCNIMYRTQVISVTAHTVYDKTPTRIHLHNLNGAFANVSKNTKDPRVALGISSVYPPKEIMLESEQRNDGKKGDKPSEDAVFRNDYTRGYIKSELLETEKYTGPIIQDISAPYWYDFISLEYNKLGYDGITGYEKALQMLHERFLARELLAATYNFRSVSVTSTFDPYVTPGFPGVVFDNADTRLSMCGYVTSVQHNITVSGATTQVTMSHARLLLEGACVEIPHPVTMVECITHNGYTVGELYKQILGTPNSTEWEGAKPIELKALYKECTEINKSFAAPQNSLIEAYKSKRRNIATFEDYCSFMGITCGYSAGPDGPKTATILYQEEYLDDRHLLPEYEKALTDELFLTPAITPYAQIISRPDTKKLRILSDTMRREVEAVTAKIKQNRENVKKLTDQLSEQTKEQQAAEAAYNANPNDKAAQERLAAINDKISKTNEAIRIEVEDGNRNLQLYENLGGTVVYDRLSKLADKQAQEEKEKEDTRKKSVQNVTYHRYIRDILIAISKRELSRQTYR